MCEHGDTVPVHVKIPADLSCTGKIEWRYMDIDRCIADLVTAIQLDAIDMRSSCCGHGKGDGEIQLQDGRTLVIKGGLLVENKPVATSEWPEAVSDGLVLPCGKCEQKVQFDYTVRDLEWERFVPENLRRGVLCLPCFDEFADGRRYHVERVQFTSPHSTVDLRPVATYRKRG